MITYGYSIRHRESGRTYFGISKNPELRFKQHIRHHDQTYFHSAIASHGAEAFEFVNVVAFLGRKDADLWERESIATAKTDGIDLYNLTEGGDGLADATRDKMSTSRRGKPKSEAHRKAIGDALRGQKRSAESIAKTAAGNRGKKRTPEENLKKSEATRGRPMRPQDLENLVKARAASVGRVHKGTPHTAETKEKLRQLRLGKKMSPETRAKMGASQLARQAKKRLIAPPSFMGGRVP